MKDMSIVLNKKIVNKETNEVRLVVKIDEENRKIFSVPASEPAAEPTCMATASYDLLREQAAPSGHHRSDHAESVRPLLHQEDLEVRE